MEEICDVWDAQNFYIDLGGNSGGGGDDDGGDGNGGQSAASSGYITLLCSLVFALASVQL